MPRIIGHLLLCIALIVQGIGAACAYRAMVDPGSMSMAAMVAAPGDAAMAASTQASTDMGQPQGKSCNGDVDCPGCGGGQSTTQDCVQMCSMVSTAVGQFCAFPHVLASSALALPPDIVLIVRTPAPPTPPPIA